MFEISRPPMDDPSAHQLALGLAGTPLFINNETKKVAAFITTVVVKPVSFLMGVQVIDEKLNYNYYNPAYVVKHYTRVDFHGIFEKH